MNKALVLVEFDGAEALKQLKYMEFVEDVYRTVIPVPGYILKIDFEDADDLQEITEFLHEGHNANIINTIIMGEDMLDGEPKETFYHWLERNACCNAVYQDLLDDINREDGFPKDASDKMAMEDYFEAKDACRACLRTFDNAYHDYVNYQNIWRK